MDGKLPAVASWPEPPGIAPRGTLIVIPGRGEQPEVYERFGRRISADGYRVHVVADPAAEPDVTAAQVTELAGREDLVRPLVLAGSDTGALFAVQLITGQLTTGQLTTVQLTTGGPVTEADALVLAGLPVPAEQEPGAGQAGSWEEELADRSTCPAHRGRLSELSVRRGALYEPVPEGWHQRADLGAVAQPVLGLHGADDRVSPLPAARSAYAAAARAELVSLADSTHDALNNATHRTSAATIVLFLERLRRDKELSPIAVGEKL